jgi:hypothetical protein
MKLIVALLLINVNISFAQVSFNGNVNYLKQDSENLTSNNNLAYKLKLYENHKYIVSLSNAMTVDLDCFKNEIKETNVFTTLQIEF